MRWIPDEYVPKIGSTGEREAHQNRAVFKKLGLKGSRANVPNSPSRQCSTNTTQNNQPRSRATVYDYNLSCNYPDEQGYLRKSK